MTPRTSSSATNMARNLQVLLVLLVATSVTAGRTLTAASLGPVDPIEELVQQINSRSSLAAHAQAAQQLAAALHVAADAGQGVIASAWEGGPAVLPVNITADATGSNEDTNSVDGKASALAAKKAPKKKKKPVRGLGLPAPKSQPPQKFTSASIRASFLTIPDNLLDPLIPYTQQYPALTVSNPARTSCLLDNGGTADEQTDQSKALSDLSNSNAPFVFLSNSGRRGTFGGTGYRVTQDVTINKPLIMGCGAFLNISAGVTVTITAQIRQFCPKKALAKLNIVQPIFQGPGKVVFSGPSFELFPDWWADNGAQSAVDSCTGPCTLMLTQFAGFQSTLFLSPAVGVFSTKSGVVQPANGAPPFDVISLRPGSYQRQLAINTIGQFVGQGIVIPSGVTSANILVGTISSPGPTSATSAIVFRPGGGTVSGVNIQGFVACPKVRNCVVVEGPGTVQNSVVDMNFALITTALTFRGACARLNNFVFRAQVFEPNNDPSVSALRNQCPGVISNLKFEVSTWSGGFAVAKSEVKSLPGILIQGRFARLSALFSIGGVDRNFNFFKVAGSRTPIGPTGISSGVVQTAGKFVRPQTTPQQAANPKVCCALVLGGGESLEFQGEPLYAQAFYVRAPISNPWPPKQKRTFYVRSWWAATASIASMQSLPFRGSNPGLVVTGFVNVHQKSKGKLPYVVGITLTNMGKSTITSIMGQPAHRFGVQIGP